MSAVHADLPLSWFLMPDPIPAAVFDESKHPRGQPDNAGRFKGKPNPTPPKASARRRRPLFDLQRLDEASSKSLNPHGLSLNELMKVDNRFKFSQHDNVMRGLWEILEARHDLTMVPTLWGLSGSGKTSGLKKYVRAYGARMFHINCANLSSGEVAGLPYTAEYSVSEDGSIFTLDMDSADRGTAADGRVVQAAVFMWLAQPIEWARNDPENLAIVFLDELNRAPRSVLNEMMTLISEREVNGAALPENLRMVAACNPGIDIAVTEFSAAQKARLVHLPLGAVPDDSSYRSLAGFPTLEPTTYVDQKADGSEKTEEDIDEMYHRLVDIRYQFLKRNPIYLNDLGTDSRDYEGYGMSVDDSEAAKSQIDGEGSYGTQRGWHEATRLMAARLLHMPRWTVENKTKRSLEDRKPGTYDKALVELVLAGYVGEKAARDFMIELDLLDLPSADEWLNDPDGNTIETLPTADRAAVMAKAMARGLRSSFEERVNSNGRLSTARVDEVADNMRSWIVFIDKHSGDTGSSNRPFVLTSFTETVTRLHDEHPQAMLKVLTRITDPSTERTREWVDRHGAMVEECLGYLADRDKIRSGDEADEDMFAVR